MKPKNEARRPVSPDPKSSRRLATKPAKAEALVIEKFFADQARTWPANPLQSRMQGSRG